MTAQGVSDAALAALIAGLQPTHPAHVMHEGGPDHYAASLAQQLHEAIHAGNWAEIRRISADPYLAGDDLDTAVGALACAPLESTVAELRQVLIDFEASRPRSMQKALGPSELGTPCQQQMARKLVGAPRKPITEPTWAPFQGTAVHASMEDVVAFWNQQLGRERWLAEDRLQVHPGLPGPDGQLVDGIAGNGDAFDTDHDMVVDWKHVGTTALKKLRTAKRAGKPPAEQVSADYRVQAHLYGLGHANKGRTVRYVRLVLLARSWQYDDSDEWTEPYDENVALAALDRYWATHDLINSLGGPAIGDLVAAVPAAPSKDACHWCVFHVPLAPSGWAGCAGDQQATARAVGRVADGLIEDSSAALALAGAQPSPTTPRRNQ